MKQNKQNQIIYFFPDPQVGGVKKNFYMDNLEAAAIKKFSKLASIRYKTLLPTPNNTTISFTFGNWALPYLKLLKKIGIAK